MQLLRESDTAALAPELIASEPLPADLDCATAPNLPGGGPPDQAVIDFLDANQQAAGYGPIGDWLAGLVLRGSVAAEWDALAAAGQATQTFLEVEPPTLALLPWELMRRRNLQLFTDGSRRFARAAPFELDSTQELVPLRLLAVEGTRDASLGTVGELGGITAAIPAFGGRIEARFLSEPGVELFRETLDSWRPHVLHFAGHGMLDPVSGLAALRVGDRLFTSDDVLNVMGHIPRLVVLNACRSGHVERIQSLVDAFLNRQAAAVIGMRGDIRGRSASCFGVALYRALAAGKLIDEATALARRAVYAQVGGQYRDWCLPSLTLRVRPAQVLPLACDKALNAADLETINVTLFEPTRLFIDRVDERARVVSAVDPETGPPKRLLLVTGAMNVGKSLLVTWMRTRAALRGSRVRYLNFNGDGSLGFLRALDVIRSTADDVASFAGPAGAYDRYVHDLGFLLKGQMPPQVGGLATMSEPDSDIVKLIFDSFREALRLDAADRPLLLIFDHVNGLLRPDFLNFIYPHLIKKVAQGGIPNVSLLVVLSDEQRSLYWPPQETKQWEEVPVDLIHPDQFTELALQFLYLAGTDVSEDHLKFIDLMKKLSINDRWTPVQLHSLLEVLGRVN